MPYIIYVDIESLIRKIEGCANNPENSSRSKIGEHIPWGYSIVNNWGIWSQQNNILYIVEKIAGKSFVSPNENMQKT